MPDPRLFLDILTAGRTLPDGYDSWGFKSVRPDFTTYQGYRWPWPGSTVTDPAATAGAGSACPTASTGGLCVATTWRGVAAGGHGHRTLLLLAYRAMDVLGRDDVGKLRVSACHVVELVDGEQVLRSQSAGADLARAYLAGADLTRADLAGADLAGAYLTGADLARADLTGADLTGADLARADLARANLARADLARADLTGADLTGANLTGADLTGARGLDKAIGYKPAVPDAV